MNWPESGSRAIVNYSGMKLTTVLLSLAVVFLSAGDLLAQTASTVPQKAITKKDFEQVDKKSKQILTTAPYRVTKITESFSNNEANPSVISKVIEEHAPPDRIRELIEHTIDGKLSKTEIITVGHKRFERKDAAPWKKISADFDPVTLSGPVISEQYFSDGTVVVDGKTLDVFVVTKKTKDRLGNGKAACVDKKIFWYASDGSLIKVLYDVQCENIKGRGTDVYEYDPTIKIEAPIK